MKNRRLSSLPVQRLTSPAAPGDADALDDGDVPGVSTGASVAVGSADGDAGTDADGDAEATAGALGLTDGAGDTVLTASPPMQADTAIEATISRGKWRKDR